MSTDHVFDGPKDGSYTVADQVARLTFPEDLARAIVHLRNSGAPYGTDNVTNAGAPASWADVARRIYERSGRPVSDVMDKTTEKTLAGGTGRPKAPQLRA